MNVSATLNACVQEQRAALQQLEASEEAKKRMGSLAGKIQELKAAAAEEEEEESEEEDSEAGLSSDGEDAVLDIDSGDGDDEDEEESEEGDGAEDAEEEEEEEEGVLAARRSSHGLATTIDGDAAAGGALGVDSSDDGSVCGSLFKGLVFFLAREVPREPLLFVIR